MNIRCKKCGGDVRMQVQATVLAPGHMYRNLTKTNFSKKNVRFTCVNWETADFICENVNCGHITDGYGNYFTRLERENKELRMKVAVLEDKMYEGL